MINKTIETNFCITNYILDVLLVTKKNISKFEFRNIIKSLSVNHIKDIIQHETERCKRFYFYFKQTKKFSLVLCSSNYWRCYTSDNLQFVKIKKWKKKD